MRFCDQLKRMNNLNLEWYEHKPPHVITPRYVHHYVAGLVKVLRVPPKEAEWVVYWMSVLTWSHTKQCTLAKWIEKRGSLYSPCDTLDTFCHWQSSLLEGNLMSIMARHAEWR